MCGRYQFLEIRKIKGDNKVKIDALIAKLQELFTIFGLKILAAIVILIIGLWISKIIKGIVKKLMNKSGVESTLVSFVANLIYYAVVTFVIIAALNQIGVQTASFIAVLGAAGLAVGLALQGSLANFAAGVLMIIFRPIKVDDYIEGAGVDGIVKEIQIFTTTLLSLDNKTIIIPNAKLAGDNIINYSSKKIRRVDLMFGVGYEDDIDKVKQVIKDELNKDQRILQEPAPDIAVFELADSSVNFIVRPWVKNADYWDVYFDVTENIKKRFDAEGISIPFPQQDVHMYQSQN